MSATSLRRECPRCGRPEVGCYCAVLTAIETRTRVLILQHPREHENAINTARIAALALPRASLLVGVDFADDPALSAALQDRASPPVLLFPGAGARDLEREPPSGPVTLIVIDGTWHQARSLFRKNPALWSLPRYAFEPRAPSEYRIRREPRPDYVSTIEALAAALPLLEGDRARFEALLAPFRAMVEVQLAYAARSTGARRRVRRRNDARARARLPAELLGPSLVCVTGEANAWPHDRAIGRPPHPHELVHWLAVRLSDGARIERVLAPRAPLASSPMVHARIPAPTLREGGKVDELLSSFAAFCREDDVLCTWGGYAVDLYARELGGPLARTLDLRKVTGDYLKRKPGSLEQVVSEQRLTHAPLGIGRGGERLGMLVAITRWLSDEARAERAPNGRRASPWPQPRIAARAVRTQGTR